MSTASGSSRIVSVPGPTVQHALRRPGTARLVVTQAGFEQAPRRPVEYHFLFDEVTVLLCMRGSGWIEQGGLRHRIRPGMAALFGPDEPRVESPDPEDPWAVWWLHVRGEYTSELFEASGFTISEPVRELSEMDRAIALAMEVVDTLEHDVTEPSLLVASAAAWHLIALLTSAGRIPGDRASPLDSVREHLRHHFAEQITIEDLARRVNLSESHFAALFRRRFGVTALAYQTHVRMARSRALLDNTEESIADIAHAVGYDDPSYFARRFTDTHGISPRVYRKERRHRRSGYSSDEVPPAAGP
jgi:AraC-like DNA-binding protein